MRKWKFTLLVALAASSMALATDYPEVEGNDSKATANAFAMVPGDRIIGNSISSTTTGIDCFKVTMPTAAAGIYRNRLVLTTAGTAGHTGSIRGVTVTGGVGGSNTYGTATTTDTAVQTSSTTTTPARFVQWYGFGKGESLYYRVRGTATTTVDYEATLEQTPITPTNLGTFASGQWDFTTYDLAKSPLTTGFTYTDTEVNLYDSNFNTLTDGTWNNDDFFPLSTTHAFHSELHLTLAPGTYYLAISQFNLANSVISAPQFENGPNDSILDFPDAILGTSSTVTHGTPAVPVSLDFSITTPTGGTQVFDAEKPGAYGVYWATFTVANSQVVLAPSDYAVTQGLNFGGTLASLASSNDDKVVVLCDENDSNGEVQAWATTSLPSLSVYTVKLEASASRNDLSQFLRAFNYATNSYSQIHFQSTTLADSVVTAGPSGNLNDFKSGTGEVKVSVLWIPQADIDAGDGWTQSIDQIEWTLQQ